MIWLVLAGALALLFWYNFIRSLNHFSEMGIKQVNPLPLVGDYWTFLLRLESFAEMVARLYNARPWNRYVGGYQFTKPILILRNPDLIKQITVNDFDHFADHVPRFDPSTDSLWSENLFSLKGNKWREMRSGVTGSFSGSKMKHMFGIINETAENFVEYFTSKDQKLIEVEMKDSYTKFTNDVIASAAFGNQVNSLAEPKNIFFNMATKILTNTIGFVGTLKLFLFLLSPKIMSLLNLHIIPKKVSHYFRSVIHENIKVREEKGIVRQDMINILLEARKGNVFEEENVTETGFATAKEYGATLEKYKAKQVKELSNDDITSQALVFFLGGFDTISTALCFGSYELATNKEVQDKLRQEIIATDKAVNGKLTYDTLLKMEYMDMVFSEILRIWPPIPAIDRVCTKPYTIPPIYPDEKPVHLKVGDVLWLPSHGLHRDPEFFPDPEKFKPERFSDENKQKINPYAYIPFGSGPRNCIGSRFAILAAKALLYHLLLNFEIVTTKRTRIPLELSAKSLQHTAEGGFHLGLQRVNCEVISSEALPL